MSDVTPQGPGTPDIPPTPDTRAIMYAPLVAEEMTATAAAAIAKTDKIPIVPVPDDAPPMNYRHPKHGKPSSAWPYHDKEGRVVGYVCRWDFVSEAGAPEKVIRPVTYCELGDGKRCWTSKGFEAPRPLYRLPDILARPDALVLVVEGEKTADAATGLFRDYAVTTPAHGAHSPHKTDWSPLRGRRVVVWGEPLRVCRRLQLLRGWSYDTENIGKIFT